MLNIGPVVIQLPDATATAPTVCGSASLYLQSQSTKPPFAPVNNEAPCATESLCPFKHRESVALFTVIGHACGFETVISFVRK